MLTLAAGLITACKPGGSGSDVDPRDQYVGQYEGTERSYQSVINVGTIPYEESGIAQITVSKGSNPKEVYLEISNRSLKVTAELNGVEFRVIDRDSDQINVVFNGRQYSYDGKFTATGTFGKEEGSGKGIVAINAVTEANLYGTAVRRTETIVGAYK